MADIRELMKRMGGKGKQKKKKDSNTTASLPDLEASAGPSIRTEHDSPDTTPAVKQPTNSTVSSIEELIRTKADWQKPERDGANLSRSKKAALRREFENSWIRSFPWAQPIVENKKVIGVVCGVCRGGDLDALQALIIKHSGGVWTKPFTNFGKFTESEQGSMNLALVVISKKIRRKLVRILSKEGSRYLKPTT